MPIRTYIRPASIVEAVQIEQSTINEIAAWIHTASDGSWYACRCESELDQLGIGFLRFFTFENGRINASEWGSAGEWVVRRGDGTFIVMAPDEFRRDYAELEARS